MIFDNAVLGTLSGAATQFTNGQATATYTAGATPGVGSANATADSETVLAFITIQNTTAVSLTAFSGRSGSDSRTGLWLLAGLAVGTGGLWLGRRRRELVRVKVGDERTPDTRPERFTVPSVPIAA